MIARPLGRSELCVPPVIFGAWAIGGWFWGGTDDDRAVKAIQASIDAGVCAIDTAPVYGRGHSERVVGRAIQGRRNQVIIMTKVGLRWDTEEGARFFDTRSPTGETFRVTRNLRPASIQAEVDQSLARLGVDTIDLLQCHWPDPSTPIEDSMGAMADIVRAGKARAIGVSNFDPDLLAQAQAALGDIPLASTQPRYSLIHRQIEAGVLPWCREHRVGAVVYSPMERGLLTGKVPADRVFPANDGRSLDPLFRADKRAEINAALTTLKYLTTIHQCSLAQLSLAWCFHQPGVTSAIAGARDAWQAQENAAAARLVLPKSTLAKMRSAFDALALR